VTASTSEIDKVVKEDLHKIRQYQEQTSLEIQNAFESESFEVVSDHQRACQILVELSKSIKSEALILLPIDKSIVRLDRMHIFDHIIKASQQNNAATTEVKIICPLSEINSHIVKRILDRAPNIKIINGNNSPYGMLIIDDHKLFRAELKKYDAEDLSEAIGYTIYSTSKVTAKSFKSVYELLWAELILNEELKRASNMQKEFIDIAAHELRTPAQSILGYAELANADPQLCKHDKLSLLDAIYRNAIRLQRLTRDILDVTKIESNTLQLNKEVLNLNDVISNVVSDLKTQTIDRPKDRLLIKYNSHKEGAIAKICNNNGGNNISNDNNAIFVEADKGRITQVISNILDNSIKFTKAKLNRGGAGIESINIHTQKNNDHAIVTVADTGTGIDSDIMTRVFEKFVTKSLTGTGLGLFISKSIVEAHGGRIWAQNNSEGNGGATFAFSLPLAKQY
jgi:signal transduction histidine kinase